MIFIVIFSCQLENRLDEINKKFLVQFNFNVFRINKYFNVLFFRLLFSNIIFSFVNKGNGINNVSYNNIFQVNKYYFILSC